MLDLSIKRQDGSIIDPKPGLPLFYDERVTITVESDVECELHLVVMVVGSFEERGREHSMVIFDENLSRDYAWSKSVHVRHPRSPLQNPHLEAVATARYTAPDEERLAGSRPDQSKYLKPFEPVSFGTTSAIVPFVSAPRPSAAASRHARGTSTASGINFAEVYEERRNSKTGEVVSTRKRDGHRSNGDANGQTGPKNGTQNGSHLPSTADADGDAEIRVVRWRGALSQALELEIRSIRPALERDRVIAEIDLVAGALPVRVSRCDVTLEDGKVDLMGHIETPVTLDAWGKYAMCFNLQLRAPPQSVHTPVSRKPLNIELECAVVLSDETAPVISTIWTPLVDFEGTHGPLPKTPSLTLPVNSPLGSTFPHNVHHSSSSSTLDLVASRGQNKANLGLMGGISIILTGPQFVTVGDTFEWSFKVLNRSPRSRSFTLKFASTSLPREAASHRDSRQEMTAPSIAERSILGAPNIDLLRRRAQAHYANIGASRGIIPLSQELRVGSLAPHTCFETSIELYALKTGSHSVESSRIEDLSNGDSYDVGGLLQVIVEPKR